MAQNPGPSAPVPDPNTVKLVGDRFKPLTYREMTPEQKKMFESLISGERRGAGGPFNVLLRSPEMGDLAQKFGASMRFHWSRSISSERSMERTEASWYSARLRARFCRMTVSDSIAWSCARYSVQAIAPHKASKATTNAATTSSRSTAARRMP